VISPVLAAVVVGHLTVVVLLLQQLLFKGDVYAVVQPHTISPCTTYAVVQLIVISPVLAAVVEHHLTLVVLLLKQLLCVGCCLTPRSVPSAFRCCCTSSDHCYIAHTTTIKWEMHTLLFSSTLSPLELVAAVVRHLTLVVLLLQQLLLIGDAQHTLLFSTS
jgi:hypothetical protein